MAAIAGCGERLTCAPGTVLRDGACVAVAAAPCGAGTVLQGNLCVAAADAAAGTDVLASGDGSSHGDAETAGELPAGADSQIPTDADAEPPADTADSATCVPFCIGKVCGPDGCGGSCGACQDPAKPTCTSAGQCAAACIPACNGKACGSDGCGGTCGACAANATCTPSGTCVPNSWTCKADWYGDGEVCDCQCGAADVDCAKPGTPVAGCTALQTCDSTGTCQSKIPKAWKCAPATYDALDACNCGCGAPDPDCKYASLPVSGCAGVNAACDATGTCAACVPDCSGKACGGDGCGGSCGACTTGSATFCYLGACVDPCKPKPINCGPNSCGDDGCGGSCGSCAKGSSCLAGQCVVDAAKADPTSCLGHCGSTAPAGCYCTPSCKQSGTCCTDYATVCTCKPNCTGKACGSDGCGGSCGTCPANAAYCNAKFECDATCLPACKGKACGGDGCGGVCGTCAAGSKCSLNGQCVPNGWTCDAYAYGDKQGCDCGCGAPDSDCASADTPVLGCPTAKTACTAQGICAATFCSANSECGAGKWCTGVYASGGGKFAGVCDAPVVGGLPAGVGCQFDAQCAGLVCLAGECRSYCKADSDCAAGQLCLGVPVTQSGLGATSGFAAVCVSMPGSLKPCGSQAACAASAENCTAQVDAKTLAPRYVCAYPGSSKATGASCAAFGCGLGQFCAATAKGFVCSAACPAGQSDCGGGQACQSLTFNNAGTPDPADDPKVSVCVAP